MSKYLCNYVPVVSTFPDRPESFWLRIATAEEEESYQEMSKCIDKLYCDLFLNDGVPIDKDMEDIYEFEHGLSLGFYSGSLNLETVMKTKKKVTEENWNLAVIRNEDNAFYRVFVKEWGVNESGVEVFLCDTGETICVDLFSVFPIHNALLEYPAFVFNCHMIPVRRMEDAWPEEALQYFRRELRQGRRCHMTLYPPEGDSNNGQHPVVIGLSVTKTKIFILNKEMKNFRLVNVTEHEEEEAFDDWDPARQHLQSEMNQYKIDLDDAGAGHASQDERVICPQFVNTGYCFKGETCRKEHILSDPAFMSLPPERDSNNGQHPVVIGQSVNKPQILGKDLKKFPLVNAAENEEEEAFNDWDPARQHIEGEMNQYNTDLYFPIHHSLLKYPVIVFYCPMIPVQRMGVTWPVEALQFRSELRQGDPAFMSLPPERDSNNGQHPVVIGRSVNKTQILGKDLKKFPLVNATENEEEEAFDDWDPAKQHSEGEMNQYNIDLDDASDHCFKGETCRKEHILSDPAFMSLPPERETNNGQHPVVIGRSVNKTQILGKDLKKFPLINATENEEEETFNDRDPARQHSEGEMNQYNIDLDDASDHCFKGETSRKEHILSDPAFMSLPPERDSNNGQHPVDIGRSVNKTQILGKDLKKFPLVNATENEEEETFNDWDPARQHIEGEMSQYNIDLDDASDHCFKGETSRKEHILSDPASMSLQQMVYTTAFEELKELQPGIMYEPLSMKLAMGELHVVLRQDFDDNREFYHFCENVNKEEAVAKFQPMAVPPGVGEVVLLIDDCGWERAQCIESEQDKETYKCIKLDAGGEVTCRLSQMRKMPSWCLQMPFLMRRVKLLDFKIYDDAKRDLRYLLNKGYRLRVVERKGDFDIVKVSGTHIDFTCYLVYESLGEWFEMVVPPPPNAKLTRAEGDI